MNSAATNLRTSHSSFAWKQLLLWTDVMVFVALCAVAIIFGPRNGLWICGLGIAVPSFALWMLARWQLGGSFMIKAAAEELVTTGLYRRFRHPIYLFGGLATFGALLALQNWWILAAWLVYAPIVQWARLHREDTALQAAFGEAFLEHRKHVWI